MVIVVDGFGLVVVDAVVDGVVGGGRDGAAARSGLAPHSTLPSS